MWVLYGDQEYILILSVLPSFLNERFNWEEEGLALLWVWILNYLTLPWLVSAPVARDWMLQDNILILVWFSATSCHGQVCSWWFSWVQVLEHKSMEQEEEDGRDDWEEVGDNIQEELWSCETVPEEKTTASWEWLVQSWSWSWHQTLQTQRTLAISDQWEILLVKRKMTIFNI